MPPWPFEPWGSQQNDESVIAAEDGAGGTVGLGHGGGAPISTPPELSLPQVGTLSLNSLTSSGRCTPWIPRGSHSIDLHSYRLQNSTKLFLVKTSH